MDAAGPRGAYMFRREPESPPPFTEGNWNDPIVEKVNNTAQAQRDYDAGMFSTAQAQRSYDAGTYSAGYAV